MPTTKKSVKPSKSKPKVSSLNRLESLLEETEQELERLSPQIEKLEKQVEKLRQLRLEKQKLITLKLSLQSILENYSDSKVAREADYTLENYLPYGTASSRTLHSPMAGWQGSMSYNHPPFPAPRQQTGTFIPDMAFQQVSQVLRKRNSLNYELFRAIVFNGGQASTEQIKQYLVEHQITQPASGQGFEAVELTDISSRVNYLVRKGLVNPDGRGNFVSCLGWLVDGLSTPANAAHPENQQDSGQESWAMASSPPEA